MNISLRQLRVFVAVAEALSFTRAGEALGLPQSTVSTQLRELEDALGLRLFDRHTRMLRLTEAGAEILPLARKTLADLDAVVGSSAELKTLGRGRVSIAASSVQAAMVLPRVMRAFAERHPGIRVELFDVSQDEVLSMVHSGAVDFGLGTAFGSSPQELAMRALWHESFFAVLPEGHPLAARRELAWRDLLAEPLIGPRKGNPVRTVLDFALASEGLVLTLRHEASLPLTIAGMVEGGLGIGILTSSMRQLAEALRLQLRPIHRPTIQREVVLVLHTGRSLSPAAKQFSDALIAWSRTASNPSGRAARR
ncbi:LysR family transcriptional regulator [Variovorax guangxiensis]|uniref:LysR family transcriptional regulator n=1 Tax=Variovorax guangxiensis TaxID=1775474 RepID=UPI002863F729|nr:LysR family transcriptional regulator [Variovorax guangxiensis]MDR6853839.1 DNA-binding transcriptional LysR family regulator [Variovorax guangxiensis]